MGRDWTVDTCVSYKAADVNMNAIYFLLRVIQERHLVTFDFEKHIEKEYRNCFMIVQRQRKGGSEVLKK